ncbi:MAG TPA: DUF3482 domain-containing protein [Polyangiales bacterium]|nr:DUF3482 domain-containing protein [Polyangiales bacterium]
MSAGATIAVGLISHTNAGKTTLARTLLRRDIGEVGDRAHVTEVAERHVLVESPQGDVLALWDTPGFGDSMRLFSRLSQNQNPVSWVLTQVWDRLTDRPFWSSQQAIRSAREQCDVVLYVVNASEAPEEARYIGPEMKILEWVGKPVLLLLNQLGAPRSQARVDADVALWRSYLAAHGCIRGVLSLDAFARCWVQEDTLLARVQGILQPELQPAGERLRAAWLARNLEVFDRSMRVVARLLATIASDEEPVSPASVQQKIRGWVSSVATGVDTPDSELERAQRALAERLEATRRAAIDELIELHGLSGKAASEQLQALAHELGVERPADEHKASLLGGLLSGAAGGLAADLAAGGLTFGAGALLGAVVGALGARSITQLYNVASGRETGRIWWSHEFLTRRVATSLLAYLAIAHFGRGRGEFVLGAVPDHWQQAIGRLARHRVALEAAWEGARADKDFAATEAALLGVVTVLTRDVLLALYPDSAGSVLPISKPQAQLREAPTGER